MDIIEKREILNYEQKLSKKFQDEFDHKMKYFKLHRWAIIRHYREEMESDARIRLKIKKRLTSLIRLGSTYNILKFICHKFVARREFLREEKFKNDTASMFQRVYAKYRKR